MYETIAEQRSSLIKYAEARIQKEYENNELFKEKNGSYDFLPESTHHRTMGADDEERREIVDAVDLQRRNGMSVKEACASHFISPTCYHKWRRKFNYSNFYDKSK